MVDHLLVFKGDGQVQDFPGNYTQYREYQALKSKETIEENKTKEKKTATQRNYHNETRKRMSYKEKREYEMLSADIEKLTNEIEQMERQLCSGTLAVDRLTEISILLPRKKDELDVKELRWLELSELE